MKCRRTGVAVAVGELARDLVALAGLALPGLDRDRRLLGVGDLDALGEALDRSRVHALLA